MSALVVLIETAALLMLDESGLCIIIYVLCSQAILWMICIVIISYEVLFCLFFFCCDCLFMADITHL